jgi:hypothetical protein
MVESFKLPANIKIPERFEKSVLGRNWFIEGVRDAIDELAMTKPFAISARYGVTAGEAYRLGYKAGQQWLEEEPPETRQVGDPKRGLTLELHRGPGAQLAIGREAGGQVTLDLDEVAALVKALEEAAADLLMDVSDEEIENPPAPWPTRSDGEDAP